MSKKIWIGAVAGFFALSACGDTIGEQALLGAGAGALGGWLIGDPVTGAVVGAGVNVYCQGYSNAC